MDSSIGHTSLSTAAPLSYFFRWLSWSYSVVLAIFSTFSPFCLYSFGPHLVGHLLFGLALRSAPVFSVFLTLLLV